MWAHTAVGTGSGSWCEGRTALEVAEAKGKEETVAVLHPSHS